MVLERRIDPRLLTFFGFALFAVGLLMSAHQTKDTDAAEMILPQVLRGAAIMFCLLPPTRMALGRLPNALIADASGLFNLMRNLGGAVGLALIDTTIFSRAATHAGQIADQLRALIAQGEYPVGSRLPPERPDDFTEEMVRPLVEKAALVHAINDAWMLIGILTAVALILVLFVRRAARSSSGTVHLAAT